MDCGPFIQQSKEELEIQRLLSSTPFHNTTTPFLFGLERGMLEQERELGSGKQNDRERNPFENVVCYWAILSIRSSDPNMQLSKSNLAILHLDQTLEELLGSSVQLLNGISVLNFIHPNEARRIEMEIAQYTSERRAKSKVLRSKLKDDDYQLTDIRLELTGDGMMLCFFHAVEGIDDDENKQSQRSECCKTMLRKMIETSSSNTIERHWNGFPKKIFQVLSNVPQSNVLFSWPPPRLFDSMQQQQHHDRNKSNSDIYMGGNNYSANEFARLTYQSTFQESLLARPEELTTCKRSQSLSFNVLIDGLDIDLEAIVIPHGEIKFATFSIHKADISLAHLTDPNGRSKDMQSSSPITFDRGLTSPFSTTSPEQCNQLPTNVPPKYGFPMNSISYEGIATTNKAVSLQTQPEVESGDRKQVGHTSIYEYQNGLTPSSSSPAFPLSFARPNTSPKMNSAMMMKKCLICGTSDSPEWRKGYDGKKSLCNACGLRFSRNNRKQYQLIYVIG
ncbi:uncharacterized protein FA14DRAFT_158818 [Meira miltonrushii]|uniref:GATA-type domain-containing protein n=1 Tax=Meira miltonrushii TaxID=1280837 RepID=A0A316V1M4_9BASI|nr:uncharacterized protein FA14DRAFT_158818 [Meira miltonrushii]PWN31372.1 hypothetical protein FA14DRAFT_158818 [Meira miltonrushii]